jgi:hypothetical protein
MELILYGRASQLALPLLLNHLKTEFLLIYTNSVRTSQETHYVSATKPNRLMLFKEKIAVYYCDNRVFMFHITVTQSC